MTLALQEAEGARQIGGNFFSFVLRDTDWSLD
jgi:hypothetical protein